MAAFNSDILGRQRHVSRLRRFYCDNLDKKNTEIAGRLTAGNADSIVNFQRGSSADCRRRPPSVPKISI